jgi:hypothetical protein
LPSVVAADPTLWPDGPSDEASTEQVTASPEDSASAPAPRVQTAAGDARPSPFRPAGALTVGLAHAATVPAVVHGRAGHARRAPAGPGAASRDGSSTSRPTAQPLASIAVRAGIGLPLEPTTGDQASSRNHRAAHHAARRDAAPPPVPQLPDQVSGLGGGAAGSGGGSSGVGVMALVAAFVFLSPGLTRWLRVGRGRVPRLLRAGRRERPG